MPNADLEALCMIPMAQTSSAMHSDRHILGPKDWQRIRGSLKLSGREIQITQHIFDDAKAECIAADLGISVHTVNTYLQRLYLKLDIRSRSQLVLCVLRNHIEHLRTSSNQREAVCERCEVEQQHFEL
jgi:DNA-binding CsgD family transcriptional regulator